MKKVVLLDGGMGQELIRRSARKAHSLWSAKVMMDEPHLVEEIHRDYINAGARVITLNTYSATPERLERNACGDMFEPLQKQAMEAAWRARDKSSDGEGEIRIAGCLPPLYGSYQPDAAPDFDECLDRYRVIAGIQADGVDLFICETMSSIKEGKAAALAALETGLPVWLSFTLEDNDACLLRSKEPLSDAIEAVSELGVEALLSNCSAPEAINAAISTLRSGFHHFGAYANGFTTIDKLKTGGMVNVLAAREDLGPAEYATFAMNWVEAGARIVGGCCEVGPAHISHLNRVLQARGYEITSNVQECV